MLNSRQTQVPGKRFQPLASYQSLCTGLEQTEPRGHRGGGTVQERGTLQGPAQRFPECTETGLRSQTGFSMIRFVRCLHHSTVPVWHHGRPASPVGALPCPTVFRPLPHPGGLQHRRHLSAASHPAALLCRPLYRPPAAPGLPHPVALHQIAPRHPGCSTR